MQQNLILVIFLALFSSQVISRSLTDDLNNDELAHLETKTYALESIIAGVKTDVCALESKMKEKKETLQHELDNVKTDVTSIMQLVEGHTADQAALRVDIDNLVQRLDDKQPTPVPADHYVCEEPWVEHNGQCLYIESGESLTWNSAKVRCQSYGAHLLVVDTEELNTFLKIRLRRSDGNSHFVGGFNFGRHSWLWDYPNKELDYTDWGPGQPSGGTHVHCLVICSGPSCQWNDVSCDYTSRFICQKDAVHG